MTTPPTALACFDFDGTLTRRDTMLVFSQFVHGWPDWLWRMARLLPTLAAYQLRLLRNDIAKERFLTEMFGGMDIFELEQLAERFCTTRLPGMLRPEMMAKLRWHQQEGHQIMLVTASLSFWTAPFARQEGLVLVASLPAVDAGRFTGQLAGANCYGPEKVVRLKQAWTQLAPQTPLPAVRYAYGDSQGDREMLAWAASAP